MDKQVLKERIKEVSDFLTTRENYPANNASLIDVFINKLKEIGKLNNSNEMSLMIGLLICDIDKTKDNQFAYSQWMREAKNLCVDLNRDIDKVREFSTETEKTNTGIALIEIINGCLGNKNINPCYVIEEINNKNYTIEIHMDDGLITSIGTGKKIIVVNQKSTETIKATVIENGL